VGLVSGLPLRSLHRATAWVVLAFAALHVANHLTALVGISTHLAVMNALRTVYRQPVVEVLLLGCVAFQVGSGLRLVVRGWKARAGRVAWLQAASGLYLAFFLVVHVAAVLFGRFALRLDTNFYFAAAGFQVPPFAWFFAPYYSVAVVALFAHVGCALYWQAHASRPAKAKARLAVALGAGVLVGALLTLSLAGVFESFEVPAEYRAVYDAP
jgi:succinate dehydrogenase/fumarate reductase cytochrome b subunit